MNLETIKNLLFPEYIKCIVCSCELNRDLPFCICDECMEKLPFIDERHCIVCGGQMLTEGQVCLQCKANPKDFEFNRSVFTYSGALPSIIQDFKYNSKKYLFKPLSELLFSKFKELNLDIDYVIPIPLHQNRQKARGYNQSELLCESFKDSVPILDNVLIKIKDNPQQATLNIQERQINLDCAFAVNNINMIKGKNILLVDDIYTTGTTLNSATNILKLNGVNKVYTLTLCRASLQSIIDV